MQSFAYRFDQENPKYYVHLKDEAIQETFQVLGHSVIRSMLNTDANSQRLRGTERISKEELLEDNNFSTARANPDCGKTEAKLGSIEEVEVLVRICSFLALKALGRLSCVSRIFGRKTSWKGNVVDGDGTEQRSVVDETARRWVSACPDEEQAAVMHWPGWLRRMHEIQMPSVFSRIDAFVVLSQRSTVCNLCHDRSIGYTVAKEGAL